MENGFHGRLLADNLSGLGLSHDHDHNHNHSLTQVINAVETAEATIKHQIDENIRLRTELQDKILELEKYKAYGSMALKNTVSGRDEHFYKDYGAHQPAFSVGNPEDSFRRMGDTTLRDQAGTIIVHDIKPNNDSGDRLSHKGIHSESSKLNGTFEVIGGPQVPVENSGFSQLSSPSASSLSLNRNQTEREYDRQLNYHGDGLMQIAEVDGSVSLHKQDLIQKVREQEQEIVELKRHLADYSVKEAQIRNEKYVLDKRIAYMRLAFDQQQQDLVDAASRSLSYRQDIMEENIRLSYQLQAAQQERLMFVSSLLPLLAQYSLQPPVLDAQSIVSNVKVLFKDLQEKLNITENKNGLELVPRHMISHGNVAIFSSDAPATAGWGLLNHRQAAPSAIESNIMDHDDLGLHSPPASRNTVAHDMPVTPMQGWGPVTPIQGRGPVTPMQGRGPVTPMQGRGPVTPTQGRGPVTPTQGRGAVTHHNEENTKQVTFREPMSNSQLDYPDTEGSHSDRPPPANWASGNSSYAAGPDDPNSSYSPYLAPVMEEPSSSFSDATDDDPSPAIEGLQISGDAFPGRELQASGYSINGTTSCNFEWVRHLEDGSVNYIDGAKQPSYLVTADDVDTYLAIEVQPLDDRKRKGELVKVFANERRKIAFDSEMQKYIERSLYSGHASFKISLSIGSLHIWEPGMLAIKREGYSIKCSGPSGVVVTEKFSPTTSVTIPYGYAPSFSVKSSNGEEHLLRVENDSKDIRGARDTIVLTLRLFIMRASEKVKGKRRGLFFNRARHRGLYGNFLLFYLFFKIIIIKRNNNNSVNTFYFFKMLILIKVSSVRTFFYIIK